MNENLLDVLLYLFENFSLPEVENAGMARADLDEAGFFPEEIDDAFAWIRAAQPGARGHLARPSADSIRLYTDSERHVLDADCRGLLTRLQHCGVLTPAARELVIDRMLALTEDATENADCEQLKWVVMMVLSSSGQEEASAHMEAMIHVEAHGVSH